MRDLPIPTSKWLRAHNSHEPVFLNKHGQSCILGHVMLACGVPPSELLDISAISNMHEGILKRYVPEPLYDFLPISQWPMGSTVSIRLVNVNDDRGIDDAERERLLTLYLAPLNFQPIFIHDEDSHATTDRQPGVAQ